MVPCDAHREGSVRNIPPWEPWGADRDGAGAVSLSMGPSPSSSTPALTTCRYRSPSCRQLHLMAGFLPSSALILLPWLQLTHRGLPGLTLALCGLKNPLLCFHGLSPPAVASQVSASSTMAPQTCLLPTATSQASPRRQLASFSSSVILHASVCNNPPPWETCIRGWT